jgi:PadR family transcriptional regulator, regulatory protein PadR
VKGERLGEFEELSLLAICALTDAAYGVAVQQHLEKLTSRPVAMGAVYASLERLERKGFVRSSLTSSTGERGGKRKRIFQPTDAGREVLRDVRRLREAMWRSIEQPKRGRA